MVSEKTIIQTGIKKKKETLRMKTQWWLGKTHTDLDRNFTALSWPEENAGIMAVQCHCGTILLVSIVL